METLFAIVLPAVGGAIVTLISIFVAKRKSKSETDISDGVAFKQGLINAVEKKNQVMSELVKLKTEIHAPRVLILKSENGGGIPKATDHVYLSVLEEVPDSNIHPIKDKVQKLPSDKAYNDLIIRLIQDGGAVIKTKDMDAGILKDFYTNEGIYISIVKPIVSLKDKFLYSSFAWREDITEKLQEIESDINSRLNNIKTIYESE